MSTLFAFNTGSRVNAKTNALRNEFVANEETTTYIVRAHRSGRTFAYSTYGAESAEALTAKFNTYVNIFFQGGNADRQDYGYIIGAILPTGELLGEVPMRSIPVYVAK